MTVWQNMQVFWDVMLCSWASSSQFDCLPLKIKATQSFKTSGTTHLTTVSHPRSAESLAAT